MSLATLLAIAIPAAVAADTTAFSPLKAKLAAGADAVLFINGDSTSYSDNGPYHRFARKIGETTDHTVILRRWSEWTSSGPTGPKEYAAPITLNEGTKPGKLLVYLAALPGATAGVMFTGPRRANAIESIPRPDCAILHHGHNMRDFPKALDDDRSSIRGLYLAALGETSMVWPGVPQIIVTQNPLRDSDKYAPVYQAMMEVANIHSGITLVDTYKAFMAAGKIPRLYRDNIHPSIDATDDSGAALTAKTLMAAWDATDPGSFTTSGWPARKAPNLILNGDFSDWTGTNPDSWNSVLDATAAKSTAIKFGSSPYSLELRPNGNETACLQKILNHDELDSVRGKPVTVALLVRSSASQPRPYAIFVGPVGGKNRTFVAAQMGTGRESWIWLVCSGITIDANAPQQSCYLRIMSAFSAKKPATNDPLYVQRVVVVEGYLPAGVGIPLTTPN